MSTWSCLRNEEKRTKGNLKTEWGNLHGAEEIGKYNRAIRVATVTLGERISRQVGSGWKKG